MTGDHSQHPDADTSKPSPDKLLQDRSSERPKKIARVEQEDPFEEDDEDEDEDADDEEQNQQKESICSEMKLNTNHRIPRYLVAVEYIGTRFSGAQRQSNARTVVGVLEDAFHKFIGRPVSIFCSSRTDAGVHALSNVCHVDVERTSKRKPGEVLPPHEPAVVKRAVNHFLQKNEGDIMVTDVCCVPSNFHSRYRARERTYFYRLLSGPAPLSTFEKDQAWHVFEELDFLAMQKACKVLVGRHDFSSFRAAACQAKSPIRTLEELNVAEVVPSLYFPSFVERERTNTVAECSSMGVINSETELLHVSAIPNQVNNKDSCGEPSPGFGMRKQHRCFVVTARARSFLYHQVGISRGLPVGSSILAPIHQ